MATNPRATCHAEMEALRNLPIHLWTGLLAAFPRWCYVIIALRNYRETMQMWYEWVVTQWIQRTHWRCLAPY